MSRALGAEGLRRDEFGTSREEPRCCSREGEMRRWERAWGGRGKEDFWRRRKEGGKRGRTERGWRSSAARDQNHDHEREVDGRDRAMAQPWLLGIAYSTVPSPPMDNP